MTRRLFTLAYPLLSAADRALIGAFRAEYDQFQMHVVEPHFTFVFGTTGVREDVYFKHVRRIAAASAAVTFHCRYAMLGADDSDVTAYVFLVPDEGNSALSLLHDQLYTGPLVSYLRLDLPYVPHITIGTLSDREKAKCLCDELNARGLSIAGKVESLTVAAMVDNKVQDLRSFALGSDA